MRDRKPRRPAVKLLRGFALPRWEVVVMALIAGATTFLLFTSK